jgi:hypothetical protein
MKPFLFFIMTIISLGMCCACGNRPQENAANSDNDHAATGNSGAASRGDDDASPAAPAVIQTIAAGGKTADGIPVQLELKISDNTISGHLQMASRRLTARGILDGNTVRCWLGSDENEFYRGNLIASKKDATLRGNFIVSNSAGEKVIRGTISD